jgi:hypothetical protein
MCRKGPSIDQGSGLVRLPFVLVQGVHAKLCLIALAELPSDFIWLENGRHRDDSVRDITNLRHILSSPLSEPHCFCWLGCLGACLRRFMPRLRGPWHRARPRAAATKGCGYTNSCAL